MPELPPAEGARIRLRALEPIDVDTLYRWENDPDVWDAGCTVAPFSRKQLWDYVDTYDGDIYAARQLRLMIALRESGETIGTLDLFDFDPANSRCGVGIFVAPAWQRKGYATEALMAVCAHLRRHLSLHQLYVTVAVDNAPSVGLFSRCGFSVAGRLAAWLRRAGTYTDAFIMQKLL